MSTTSPTEVLADLVTAIDHVGVAVPDLDEAVAFYSRTFGMVNEHEETNDEQGVREAMLVAGAGQARLQLLAPLRPDSSIGRFIERTGPGLQQLALRVTDVEEAGRRLTAAGIRVLYDAPRRGTADSRINFVHPKDCGGVLVELVEPADPTHE